MASAAGHGVWGGEFDSVKRRYPGPCQLNRLGETIDRGLGFDVVPFPPPPTLRAEV